MVSVQEICVLNLVLDKRNYFSLPELSSVTLTSLLTESIYESLVQKGLMYDSENFTLEGASLVQKMLDYKNAKKYIRVGALIIGIYKPSLGIALVRREKADCFGFERVKLENIIEQLAKTYAFLTTSGVDGQETVSEISYEKLAEQYSLSFGNSLYVSTFDMVTAENDLKGAATNEILFFDKGAHYCYNRDRQMLYSMRESDLQKQLLERMVI